MEVTRVVPVLRAFDLQVTLRFYVDYLGCSVDWREGGEADGPFYMQVSRGDLVLHLSSHHGDGTPGSVVLVYVNELAELHAELHAKDYPFYNPGIEEHGGGHAVSVEDPASNTLRFFERGA